jgi:hypothetical protein
MRVLGISGSLRRGSLNTALLRAAAERLPAGVELVGFDRLGDVPPYDEDVDPSSSSAGPGVAEAPEAVRELREAILAADAVLVATPEYNHSIPGQLKNALDWVSRRRAAGARARAGAPPRRDPRRAGRRGRARVRSGRGLTARRTLRCSLRPYDDQKEQRNGGVRCRQALAGRAKKAIAANWAAAAAMTRAWKTSW